MPRPRKKTIASKAPSGNGEPRGKSERKAAGFSEIWVAGFKSIVDEQRIEIKPLTILAGANSSGKSSIMQPLLLLKQTLSSQYDPGALLLDGPNVKFTEDDQLLSRKGGGKTVNDFHVGIKLGSEIVLTIYFMQSKNKGKGFEVERTIHNFGKQEYPLYRGMSQDEIKVVLTDILAP